MVELTEIEKLKKENEELKKENGLLKQSKPVVPQKTGVLVVGDKVTGGYDSGMVGVNGVVLEVHPSAQGNQYKVKWEDDKNKKIVYSPSDLFYERDLVKNI